MVACRAGERLLWRVAWPGEHGHGSRNLAVRLGLPTPTVYSYTPLALHHVFLASGNEDERPS